MTPILSQIVSYPSLDEEQEYQLEEILVLIDYMEYLTKEYMIDNSSKSNEYIDQMVGSLSYQYVD